MRGRGRDTNITITYDLPGIILHVRAWILMTVILFYLFLVAQAVKYCDNYCCYLSMIGIARSVSVTMIATWPEKYWAG